MAEEMDFEICLESLPGTKGVAARTKTTREFLTTLGNFLLQMASDPTRSGVLIFLHEDGDISLSSKGSGGEAGHA